MLLLVLFAELNTLLQKCVIDEMYAITLANYCIIRTNLSGALSCLIGLDQLPLIKIPTYC